MQFAAFLIAVNFIAATIWLLRKNRNAALILIVAGVLMSLAAWLLNVPGVRQEFSGFIFFELQEWVTRTFSSRLAGNGLMVMLLFGYLEYMKRLKADRAFVYVMMQPLSVLRNYPNLAGLVLIPFGVLLSYALPSATAVGLLLVAAPPGERNAKLWIPCIINALVYCTAFFSPVAFSFDESYAFVRGPLSYTVLVVSVIYVFWILQVTNKHFYDGKGLERIILVICAVSCVLAGLLDNYFSGRVRLIDAIMISLIFYYIFLRTHDNRRDALTNLLNRHAFYDDIVSYRKGISAVASLDMNGLKELNDSKGHQEGDAALTTIGKCLMKVSSRDVLSYRMGGDEFIILFFHYTEEAVQEILSAVNQSLTETGYSLSQGYAMRPKGEDLENTIRLSDERMYENKADYYRHNDRRKSR